MIIYLVAIVVRLYDVELNRNELKDLAGNPKYKVILDNLFIEFKNLQKELNDPLELFKNYTAFFTSD